ncbi:hypothetical protein NQZ68_037094 [Dissostichus eleginoides]|nr:hypothetical protein NQZ68_037094 [Dissostichus eleginoides]
MPVRFIPDVAMIRRKGRLFPRGGCNEMETLFCFPKGELLPPSGRHLLVLVGRDSWCCESGRRNQGPATSQHQGPTLTPHILTGLTSVSKDFLIVYALLRWM